MAIEGANHFQPLYPLNRLLARTVRSDSGVGKFELAPEKLAQTYAEFAKAQREVRELQRLTELRERGVQFLSPQRVTQRLVSDVREDLQRAALACQRKGYTVSPLLQQGESFLLLAEKELHLGDLRQVFSAAETIDTICSECGVDNDGWDIAVTVRL